MADNIELFIKIDENTYNNFIHNEYSRADVIAIHTALMNGTPLSKGHRRILDEKDILDTKNNDGGWYDLVDMPEYIAGVKPIIEAESEEKHE